MRAEQTAACFPCNPDPLSVAVCMAGSIDMKSLLASHAMLTLWYRTLYVRNSSAASSVLNTYSYKPLPAFPPKAAFGRHCPAQLGERDSRDHVRRQSA